MSSVRFPVPPRIRKRMGANIDGRVLRGGFCWNSGPEIWQNPFLMATYISASGAKKLAAELRRLAEVERPKVVQEVAEAASHGDRSENAEYKYGKRRLREIDGRLRFLTKRLDDLVVVSNDHCPPDTGKVYFGAWVRLEDEDGQQREYQLVGPDEAVPENGQLSYQSPLGKALMAKRVGDIVVFKRPAGEIELQVLEIDYRRGIRS